METGFFEETKGSQDIFKTEYCNIFQYILPKSNESFFCMYIFIKLERFYSLR